MSNEVEKLPEAGEQAKELSRLKQLLLAKEEHIKNACDLLDAKDSELKAKDEEIEKHRWIPVSERLPKEGGLYYTFARYTSMPLAVMFHLKDKKWKRPNQVTHWKPIILPVQKETL